MLMITAYKHSHHQIRLEFQGPANHQEVAKNVLRRHVRSETTTGSETDLIVDVSSELLADIVSLSLIDEVDGTVFLPIFIPKFGKCVH